MSSLAPEVPTTGRQALWMMTCKAQVWWVLPSDILLTASFKCSFFLGELRDTKIFWPKWQPGTKRSSNIFVCTYYDCQTLSIASSQVLFLRLSKIEN